MFVVGIKDLRDSWIAQLLKNLPVMQEILVQFLDWEDALEKSKITVGRLFR